MDKKYKIASAIGVGVLLVGATALAVHKVDSNSTQEKIDSLVADYNAKLAALPAEKIVTVVKEVPVNVTVTKEVLVDNSNLAKVMDFVEDNFDEDITVDYIVFETDAKIEAEAYIRSNFKTLLKDNDFFDDGEALDGYRTTEVSIRDISDAEVGYTDYEDKDVTLSYEVKIKALEDGEDKEYVSFTFEIPFEDGVLIKEDVEVDLI